MRFLIFKFLLEISRPFNIVLVFLLFSLFQLARKKAKCALCFLTLAVLFLFLFSSPALSNSLLLKLETQFPALAVTAPEPADAIVVLGGTVVPAKKPREQPEEPHGERLSRAAQLFLFKKSSLIIVSGGTAFPFLEKKPQPESMSMKEYLTNFQIPKTQIIEESKSRNTEENALYTAQILKTLNLRTIILVTSAYHMPRAMKWFNRIGVKITPFPTDFKSESAFKWKSVFPSPEGLVNFSLALKEYLGLLAFSVFH
ncbi:MAG: YdcF family protein [Proteobacteria bacterium]|nr:YdcF family protein [Pseudomonadota bacterium]